MRCHYDNTFTWKRRYRSTQSLLLSACSCLQVGLKNTVPIGRSHIILTDVDTNHWKIPVTPTYDCSNTATTFRKKHNFNVQTYKAQLVGAAAVIDGHLTKTPCPAIIDTNRYLGLCIPQENPSHIIVWRDPHHKRQEMNTLGIHKIQQQRSYIIIPSLQVGEAIRKKSWPTRGILQLDNGLVIKHVEVIKSFLQGLLHIVTK